ncbi:MAG: hypothetical protein AMXMBFR34_20040 [Myxococcaceae bacterium]
MKKLLWLALWASGCTFPQVVPEALSDEYKPTGEVRMYDRGATFDAVRVRSPYANLSKRTDGSWGGVLVREPVDVTVTDKTVRGVNFVLTREESAPGKLIITGQFKGKIYRFEFEENIARIRAPVQSLDFQTRWPIDNGVAYGPMKSLQLYGEAAAENPPWPQIAFALVAMFD